MRMTGARARLRSGAALRDLLRDARERDRANPLDLDPRSAYELLTRQMVAALEEELREIRLRVNGLIFVTIGAVLADVALRLSH